MESTQKFDCWEELSDEELASISGGTSGSTITSSNPLGSSALSVGSGGVSVSEQGKGGLGYATAGVTKDGITSSSNGLTGIQKDISISY